MNSQKRIQPFRHLMVVLLMSLAVASANAQSRQKEFPSTKTAQQPAATQAYTVQSPSVSSWIYWMLGSLYNIL